MSRRRKRPSTRPNTTPQARPAPAPIEPERPPTSVRERAVQRYRLREYLREMPGVPSKSTLVKLRKAQDVHNRGLAEAVWAARDDGHSWRVIGEVLGVSAQAVHKRFGTWYPHCEITLDDRDDT